MRVGSSALDTPSMQARLENRNTRDEPTPLIHVSV
jgi:hypothetical protein